METTLSYLSPKTRVRRSPIHGRGLFAAKLVRKGEIVAIKGGHVYDRRTHRKVENAFGAVDVQIADNFFIGPLAKSEVNGSLIYSNHSCRPNIGLRGQITFAAMRNIRRGEELTHDWAMTDNERYRMRCNCGAKYCRRIITGHDWKRMDLQRKYGNYFSSYLLEKIGKHQ